MHRYVPRIVVLWVADVTLRLIHLTNGGKLLEVAKDHNFLWDSWRKSVNGGVSISRSLRSPDWNQIMIHENTMTTTDGYPYTTWDINDPVSGRK